MRNKPKGCLKAARGKLLLICEFLRLNDFASSLGEFLNVKDDMKELLDFIEAEARANAAFHITNADNLTKESNSLLNLLLAGAGGALAFAAALIQKTMPVPEWQVWAVTSAALYLFTLSALVVFKCLWVQDIWPPANEPKNYPLSGYTVEEIRKFDLENKQTCCDSNRLRNEKVGVWLNRCRVLAALTPLVTVLVAAGVVAAA